MLSVLRYTDSDYPFGMLNPVLIKPVYPHHVSLKCLCQSCTHKGSLSPPCFIKVPVSSQVSIRSCICVLWVSSLSMFLRYSDYIVELFFVFHVNTHYSGTPIHIRVENMFYIEMKNRDI